MAEEATPLFRGDELRKVEGRLSIVDAAVGPLKSGDGGGTFDGMDARVKALETHVEYIRRDIGEMRTDVRDLRTEAHRDFKLIFGAIIAVSLGLAGLMAKGFKWL